ncbi:MAG: radical SAM protein [Verrucomicrobia bacterium]|nr:radical SAM protein [Verrucomicrobiota bacterium]
MLDPAWLQTPTGEPRGYIESTALTELWFHTGTNCNLSCPFCLEGSKPGDDRIKFITLDDARPFIEEAIGLGVRKFFFTGGEPFVNPHFPDILGLALEHRPALVLTNGTEPLLNRFADVVALRGKPHAVSFRVSLDHPDPKKHDESRGKGNFRMALKTLGRLHEAGFAVSIARLMLPEEDTEARNQEYAPYFAEAGLPPDLLIVKFPDFLTPGALSSVPHVTEHCMTTYTTEAQRADYMCSFSRMIVKKNGRCGVYACTLVDDDEAFDLAPTLRESLQVRIRFKHHRCYSCFAYGSSCSEGS